MLLLKSVARFQRQTNGDILTVLWETLVTIGDRHQAVSMAFATQHNTSTISGIQIQDKSRNLRSGGVRDALFRFPQEP